VIHEPVEIEQSLIHHVVVVSELVLEDYRRAILIEAESVDAAPVFLPCGELGRDESDTK
jgi:hypothetical protein